MNWWISHEAKAGDAGLPLKLDLINQIASEASDCSDGPENTYDDQEVASDEGDNVSNHTEDCLDENEIINRICEPDLEYNDWITTSVQQVQEARESKRNKKHTPSSQSLITIEEQWATLELAIQRATEQYEQDHKANPKCVVPHLLLGELREFNLRRKDMTLAGTKAPAIQALVLTAQGSLRRLPNNCREFSSGVGRARKIWAQAKHLIKFGEVIVSQSGFSSRHPLLLDHLPLPEELCMWSFSKRPGEVRKVFEIWTFNKSDSYKTKLINHTLSLLWLMYALLFLTRSHPVNS